MSTSEDARSVLIVDDEPSLRERIRELIAEGLPSTVVGEAGSGAECLAHLRAGRWDVVVLDIRMADGDGFDVLAAIKTAHRDVSVMMLSGLPYAQFAPAASRAGAIAYIEKDRAANDLLPALRDALARRGYA